QAAHVEAAGLRCAPIRNDLVRVECARGPHWALLALWTSGARLALWTLRAAACGEQERGDGERSDDLSHGGLPEKKRGGRTVLSVPPRGIRGDRLPRLVTGGGSPSSSSPRPSPCPSPGSRRRP